MKKSFEKWIKYLNNGSKHFTGTINAYNLRHALTRRILLIFSIEFISDNNITENKDKLSMKEQGDLRFQ